MNVSSLFARGTVRVGFAAVVLTAVFVACAGTSVRGSAEILGCKGQFEVTVESAPSGMPKPGEDQRVGEATINSPVTAQVWLYDVNGDNVPDIAVNKDTGEIYMITSGLKPMGGPQQQSVAAATTGGRVGVNASDKTVGTVSVYSNRIDDIATTKTSTVDQLLQAHGLNQLHEGVGPQQANLFALHDVVVDPTFLAPLEEWVVEGSIHWRSRFHWERFDAYPMLHFNGYYFPNEREGGSNYLNIRMRGAFKDVARYMARMGCKQQEVPVPELGTTLSFTVNAEGTAVDLFAGTTFLATIPLQ